jgi:two-component system, response regulator
MPVKRILLVDDTPLDIELTCLALAEEGFVQSVEVAVGGQAALDYLRRLTAAQLPELLLLDLKMPGVDGLVVLRQIRSTPQWQTLRVVMLTTSAEPRDRAACLQGGADAFVHKSTQLKEFIQSMREVVRTWLVTPVPCDQGAAT